MIFLPVFLVELISTVLTLTLPIDLAGENIEKIIGENDTQSIKFYCIHSSDRKYKDTLIDDTQLTQKINLNLDFAFYVYGWHSKFSFNEEGSNEHQIGIEWVQSRNTNFCGVDWRQLAREKYYDASQVNAKIVGSQIATFIQMLDKNGFEKINSISIAGHSLGAQISGFAGKRVHEMLLMKISRIYGLDPAGPRFTSTILKNSDFHLSDKDADFVQVLHTAAGTLGTSEIFGHADFFANNGKIQEHCMHADPVDIIKLLQCSHSHAIDIFRYSSTHSFVGVQQETGIISRLENLFTSDDDGNITDLYGIQSKGLHGKFKLTTSSESPYCIDC